MAGGGWTDVKTVRPVVNGVAGGGRQVAGRHVSLADSHRSSLRVGGEGGGPESEIQVRSQKVPPPSLTWLGTEPRQSPHWSGEIAPCRHTAGPPRTGTAGQTGLSAGSETHTVIIIIIIIIVIIIIIIY